MPAQAPRPWTKRARSAIRSSAQGCTRPPRPHRAPCRNKAAPCGRSCRRPVRRRSGPTATARKNAMMLPWAAAGAVSKSLEIAGNAGRYMSIANGPTADNRPRTIAFRAKLRFISERTFGGRRSCRNPQRCRVGTVPTAMTRRNTPGRVAAMRRRRTRTSWLPSRRSFPCARRIPILPGAGAIRLWR